MAEKLLTLLSFLIVFCFSHDSPYDYLPEPTEPYENLEILCKPNRYVLYWTYNQTDITFEVIVKTNGWISFGLSPDGQIYYSDFVVAWVYPDGTGHFSGIYRIK
jgi:hypothetical protein